MSDRAYDVPDGTVGCSADYSLWHSLLYVAECERKSNPRERTMNSEGDDESRMMSKFDVPNGVGCSGNSNWETLLYGVELLSERNIEPEQLMTEIKQSNPPADHLPHGFNKGKRSPREKKVVFLPFLSRDQSLDDATATTRTRSGLKLSFKTNLRSVCDVVCTQESVSKKITIKTPSSQNLDKNPRKRMMNSKEDGEGTSKKRAKKSSVVTDPAPDLSGVFKNRILECGGDPDSVILIIQKELTKTDLSKGHARLSVPYKKVINEFLKAGEVDKSNTEKVGLETTLIQPCLEECKISLRNWESNTEYVLVRDWKKVCSRNALREGMKIQLWSFRRNPLDHLCFVLIIVD